MGSVTPSPRIALVTGANRGIGWATAHGLMLAGATVVLACRDAERGRRAAQRLRQHTDPAAGAAHVLVCDLASLGSVRAAAGEFADRFPALNVLVNNAALVNPGRELTVDGLEAQFQVNYLAPFLLTRLLEARLRAGAPARVVNVVAANHVEATLALDDLQSERDYQPRSAYKRAKLALVMCSLELADRWRDAGIAVNCLHPGVIATRLLKEFRTAPPPRSRPATSPGGPAAAGAAAVLRLACAPELAGITGRYFFEQQAAEPAPAALDPTQRRRLWRLSEALAGL